MTLSHNCYIPPHVSFYKPQATTMGMKPKRKNTKNTQWWRKDGRFSNVSTSGWDFRKTDEEREMEIVAAIIEPPATQKEIDAVAASRAKKHKANQAAAEKKKAPSRRNRIALIKKPINKDGPTRFQILAASSE